MKLMVSSRVFVRRYRIILLLLVVLCLIAQIVGAQNQRQAPVSGRRYPRIVIHNAIVVDGNGTPASGPKDIVIEGNKIAQIIPLDPVATGRGGARRTARADR